MGRPAPKIGFNVAVTANDLAVAEQGLEGKAQELDATFAKSGVVGGVLLGRVRLNQASELFQDEHNPIRQALIDWLTAQPTVTASEVGPLSEDSAIAPVVA